MSARFIFNINKRCIQRVYIELKGSTLLNIFDVIYLASLYLTLENHQRKAFSTSLEDRAKDETMNDIP